MIIDEEQHFGVKQKERLKEMRAEVHVLTLTATPIPRTLQLALRGVRELSLIATPPLDRLGGAHFRAALRSDGDPRCASCANITAAGRVSMSARASKILPASPRNCANWCRKSKLVTAHGRMSAGAARRHHDSVRRKQYDILLATNIVESGLDIPNANTIIIHRADMFGLAQLYQLRGRVGRAKLRGYAYLTYAPTRAAFDARRSSGSR